MSALPSDTACESAWDKDSGRFYDDDTGWSQRGYEAGFAAGATWGAEWYAGHMAVCEFLADLARIYAQCPRCSGFGETMEAPCVVCGTPPDEGCLCALRDVVTP